MDKHPIFKDREDYDTLCWREHTPGRICILSEGHGRGASPHTLEQLNELGLLATVVAREAGTLTDEELGWAITACHAGAMESFIVSEETAREVLAVEEARRD